MSFVEGTGGRNVFLLERSHQGTVFCTDFRMGYLLIHQEGAQLDGIWEYDHNRDHASSLRTAKINCFFKTSMAERSFSGFGKGKARVDELSDLRGIIPFFRVREWLSRAPVPGP